MDVLRNNNALLTIGVFLPLAGVLVMMLIPRRNEMMHKQIALLTALATLAVGIVTLFNFNYHRAGTLQFWVDAEWIPVIKSGYTIGLDGISLPLYILSMIVTVLVMIYSWDHIPPPGNAKAFLILMLILQVGMAGTFVAQDLILFFVFFELVLLPMYFMIGVWGGEQRQYASLKFFLYTMFGSALMLVAFLALFWQVQQHVPAGVDTSFSIPFLTQYGGLLGKTVQVWLFAGMFIGFAVKVPMFPFHTWLPDAHTQAPTQGSVILAAILLKLGTYGFVRIAIPILPTAARVWAPYIGALAVIGIIYGALGCLAQTDMKRLIAFSSVAHMGFVMLGISTLTPLGFNAAIFGMVAHGLITGMLFFVAGSVKDRYHTLEIRRLGGMLKQVPKMGWILGFCAMASLGLPGLAGFWGEFPAIVSSYSPAPGLRPELWRVYMVVAAVGTVLAAGYLLWLFQRVAFGEPRDEFVQSADDHGRGGTGVGAHAQPRPVGAHSVGAAVNDLDQSHANDIRDDHHGGGHDDGVIRDVKVTEWIAWTPFLVGIVVLGVYPQLLFRVLDPATQVALRAFGKG